MPILNYTTKIDPSKTAMEVMKLLGSKGAQSTSLIYESFEPAGITFALIFEQQAYNYKLPLNWRGVLKAMQRDRKIPRSACNDSQARRVAWRILKDWIEAQWRSLNPGRPKRAKYFFPMPSTAMARRYLRLCERIQGDYYPVEIKRFY